VTLICFSSCRRPKQTIKRAVREPDALAERQQAHMENGNDPTGENEAELIQASTALQQAQDEI
jgi:hypothetical protein